MTFQEIYKELKQGVTFKNGYQYICIGTCDRWGSPSYGKDYIYFQHAGSSADSVSFANMKWIIQHIFGCSTANEFTKTFKEEY